MKLITWLIFSFAPFTSPAQQKIEVREFTGKILSFYCGYSFAYEQLYVDVNGVTEGFKFSPQYGKLVLEKFKIGDQITLKANDDVGLREQLKRAGAKRGPNWKFVMLNQITEIKVDADWIKIENLYRGKPDRSNTKVFIEREIKDIFLQDNHQIGLKLEGGLIAYTEWFSFTLDKTPPLKSGDHISFAGFKLPFEEGYVYPMEGVKQVYHVTPLKQDIGKLNSFLFKQNFVCIGVKFKTNSDKELKLSFPGDRAIEVKEFLKPDIPLIIYYNAFETGRPNDLPELHAVIQNRDTLFISDIGFFGGADGKHDYTDIEFKGKITKVNKSEKGNVISIIVDSEYYVEIDAMMAQQLGTFFHKGKELIVAGKERVKKIGEIYSKNYRIISPEKIAIDGKYFSLYQP